MTDESVKSYTMTDQSVTRRDPHVTVPVGNPTPPPHPPLVKQVPSIQPSPRKPPVSLTTLYTHLFLKHLKQEYWAYIALIGLTCLYTGIMVAVFGFSDILDPSHGQVEWFGIFLILVGVALLLASGILYHRKNRRLRPCICCGVDLDDTPEYPVRNKKRLRFAPNLISPYYEVAKKSQAEREATLLVATSPVEELHQELEATMLVTTSPVEELHQDPEATMLVTKSPVVVFRQETEMMETDRGDNSEGSSTALITRETKGSKVTLC